MADAPLITPGRRTISRVPTAPIDQRREGRIDHAQYHWKVWKGPTVESVVSDMTKDLGAVPEPAYEILE